MAACLRSSSAAWRPGATDGPAPFQHLERYRKILVTGPYRAGTTIAATMIAEDTGHGLVREELCNAPNLDLGRLEAWLHEVEAPVVLQAPFAADVCHQFPTALVVFMHRDPAAIARSMREHKRIAAAPRQTRILRPASVPLASFGFESGSVDWLRMTQQELAKYHADAGADVIALKYEAWQDQRERLPHYLELRYDALQSHRLWVDHDVRQHFHMRQTSALGH